MAFAICTALEKCGVRVVLTGGSAATVYAPRAYQSRDLDFIVQFHPQDAKPGEVLANLGYKLEGQTYAHSQSPLTLDFPPGPLMIGSDYIHKWTTLRSRKRILHILSPTDCCRDRLAGFLFWKDFRSLDQALAVARAQSKKIKLKIIRDWCKRENCLPQFNEFLKRLKGFSKKKGSSA